MAFQPHPRSTIPQSRAHGSPLTLAGHRPSGSDANPFANEGRGTPRDTTEGLDLDQARSDHSNPYHTTLEQSCGVSEPKGGIDVFKESSSPDSVLGRGLRQLERLLPGCWRALLRRKSHQPPTATPVHLEHLECSYQPHIQGRGAQKRTQRAG